jgi:hypothetical protein
MVLFNKIFHIMYLKKITPIMDNLHKQEFCVGLRVKFVGAQMHA